MRKLYALFVFIFFFISSKQASSQCAYYPVSIDQRVAQSKYIVLGKVIEKQTYIDQSTGSVNTLNKLQVTAWLKSYSHVETVYVITLGGIYEDRKTEVYPSLQLDEQHEYILMLEEDNNKIDDKNFRAKHPQSLQLLTYADAQGSFANENNVYRDYFDKTPLSEAKIFENISRLTKETAKKPAGLSFEPRMTVAESPTGITAITSFSPTTTRSGTIVPGDFITITGSGFGAAAGTVFFTNADDGGATFTSSGVASDVTSWSNTSITVKVPSKAGTGPINVNGSMTSATNLTIQYSHIAINSNFSGFGVSTRQRYYHRNMNGSGGYTFVYNTTSGFSANAPAVAAFARAVDTWRTNTLINWQATGTTALGFGVDGANVVLFDGTLSAGTLARATSQFNGSANGACSLTNTVWCVTEIDVQVFPDPPVTGFPWQYGPAAPTSSQYDFESVVLHELGHAQGLGHVISPGAVMHYALSNGSSNRTLSANDIAGGSARVSYSTPATCFNPGAAACGSGPMTLYVVLPLQLTSFTGERISASSNKLHWITAQEQNTRGFIIQRSGDGASFSDIGFVAAAGNSNQAINYTYSDNTAGPHGWYYRLKMTDNDGSHTFSSTIFIEGDQSVTWKVWTDETGSKIYLYGNTSASSTARLNVYGANGQQVLSKSISVTSDEVSTGFLSRGLYHYQLLYNGKIISGKLFLGAK